MRSSSRLALRLSSRLRSLRWPRSTPSSGRVPAERRAWARVCVLPLVLVTLATGCDYFGEVPRPASDWTPPEGIVAVWYDDDYQELEWGAYPYYWSPMGSAFYHEVTNPNKTYYAVGAGMDDGGVRTVIQFMTIRATCQGWWSEYTDIVDDDLAITDAPDPYASTGELVPDGLWSALAFRPQNYINACGSDTLVRLEARWDVEVEDFASMDSFFGYGRMYYEP